MNKKYYFRILGGGLFAIGVVLGIVLFGVSAWAGIEAAFYGFEEMGGGRLNTLDCPIIMSKSDVGTIHATFKNPNDTAIHFMVRADFSNTGEFRTESSMLTLDPHQSKTVDWHMTSQDIDLGNFIFAQVSNFPAPSIPFRQATCGVVVVDIPQLTGGQIFTIVMIVIISGIVGGLSIWDYFGSPFSDKLLDTSRAMKTLGVLVMVGMLVSFQGSWLFGIIAFAGCVLAIGVIIGFILSQ
jgi:hypothetical protein